MKTKLIALILFTLSFSSCKKDEKTPDPLSLLTSKPWKPITHGNVLWSPCKVDNTYKFDINKLTIENGPVKCTGYQWAEEPIPIIEADVETVDYQVDFTNKTLSFKGVKYKIEEISDKYLVLYADIPASSSGFTGIRYPYEH